MPLDRLMLTLSYAAWIEFRGYPELFFLTLNLSSYWRDTSTVKARDLIPFPTVSGLAGLLCISVQIKSPDLGY